MVDVKSRSSFNNDDDDGERTEEIVEEKLGSNSETVMQRLRRKFWDLGTFSAELALIRRGVGYKGSRGVVLSLLSSALIGPPDAPPSQR